MSHGAESWERRRAPRQACWARCRWGRRATRRCVAPGCIGRSSRGCRACLRHRSPCRRARRGRRPNTRRRCWRPGPAGRPGAGGARSGCRCRCDAARRCSRGRRSGPRASARLPAGSRRSGRIGWFGVAGNDYISAARPRLRCRDVRRRRPCIPRSVVASSLSRCRAHRAGALGDGPHPPHRPQSRAAPALTSVPPCRR